MKKILFISSVLSFSITYAQQIIIPPKNQPGKDFKNYHQQKPGSDTFIYSSRLIVRPPQAKFSHILPNNAKVYLLPLDNMACIVPDMSQFNMPNAGIPNQHVQEFLKLYPQVNKKQSGQIPNAVTPYNVIPQRKDTPTLSQ